MLERHIYHDRSNQISKCRKEMYSSCNCIFYKKKLAKSEEGHFLIPETFLRFSLSLSPDDIPAVWGERVTYFCHGLVMLCACCCCRLPLFLFFSRDRIDPLFKMAESAALPRWRSWTIPSGKPALLTQIKTAPPFTCHAIGSSSWLVARERGIHAGVYMFGSEVCVLYPAHYR